MTLDFPSLEQQKETFLSLLQKLTDEGRATWLKRPLDENFFYCFMTCSYGTELALFECTYPSMEGGISDGGPDSIICRVKNQLLIWLPLLEGFDQVKELLNNARSDGAAVDRLSSRALLDLFDALR